MSGQSRLCLGEVSVKYSNLVILYIVFTLKGDELRSRGLFVPSLVFLLSRPQDRHSS